MMGSVFIYDPDGNELDLPPIHPSDIYIPGEGERLFTMDISGDNFDEGGKWVVDRVETEFRTRDGVDGVSVDQHVYIHTIRERREVNVEMPYEIDVDVELDPEDLPEAEGSSTL